MKLAALKDPDLVIVGPRIRLVPLSVDHVSATYVSWLEDPTVTRHLDTRPGRNTIASVREFVETVSADPLTLACAIVVTDEAVHIGNIKLGPVSRIHRRAELGIMIGSRLHWGLGFAGEAIRIISAFAFKVVGIEKLGAGVQHDNAASIRAFRSAGFEEEGRLIADARRADGSRCDVVRLGACDGRLLPVR